MSLPRSIDAADLGGATVTLTTTAETLVLVGPRLQTPKETSFVLTLALYSVTTGTGTTAVQGRIRSGSALTGNQVGQTYGEATPTVAAAYSGDVVAFQQVQATDYVQNCLTVQQVSATANGSVTAATVIMVSW